MQLPLFVEQQARQKAAEAISHHLPRSIGSLAEEKVAGKGGDGARQEARFRTKGDARYHNDAHNGLKIRDEGESGAGYGRNSRHDRDGHQFPGLRSALFKGKEEGDHGLNDNERAGQVIPAAGQPGPQIESRRDQQKDRENGTYRRSFHALSS